MLLKYRNSAVQPISISQTLTKIPALAARTNASDAERQIVVNDRVEESALINFFRQVVRMRPAGEKENQCGIMVPVRQTVRKADLRQTQSSGQSKKNICSLRQATNELIARLRAESITPETTSAAPIKTITATIYKYRSKASITYYDLPALVVNQ